MANLAIFYKMFTGPSKLNMIPNLFQAISSFAMLFSNPIYAVLQILLAGVQVLL